MYEWTLYILVKMQRCIVTGGNPKIKKHLPLQEIRICLFNYFEMLTLEHFVKIQKSVEIMYPRSQNWQQVVWYKQNIYNLTIWKITGRLIFLCKLFFLCGVK